MAQMLTGSAIRLIITVGTLAAIYFFIVKPILDTTDEAFDSFDSIDRSFDSIGQGLNAGEIQERVNESLRDAGVDKVDLPQTADERADKLLNCVQRAEGDVAKLQVCQSKFS